MFSFAGLVFNKVIKHFDGILFWKATVIRMTAMIKLRHQQPSLWHRGLTEDIEGLWEPWMRLVDELLEDEQLLDSVRSARETPSPKPTQNRIVRLLPPAIHRLVPRPDQRRRR